MPWCLCPLFVAEEKDTTDEEEEEGIEEEEQEGEAEEEDGGCLQLEIRGE